MSSTTNLMKRSSSSSSEQCSATTPSYSSLKDRLKSCFRCLDDDNDDRSSSSSPPRHEVDIRDMCRGLIGRRGRNRRRHCSADFSYDPASYSLNFEDPVSGYYSDRRREEDEEVPLRSFLARLPATPERVSAPAEEWGKGRSDAAVSGSRRELLACS